MGALPDREPLVGALPRRPEAAPPLSVVPSVRRPRKPNPTPAPNQQQAAPDQPKPHTDPEKGQGGLDLEQVAAVRTWALEHLRPPDLLNQASPGLKQLWDQALKGEHLPTNRFLRGAEMVRLAISLPVIAAATLLAWSMVSAARTAALLLGVAAVWMVASTLIDAVTKLL